MPELHLRPDWNGRATPFRHTWEGLVNIDQFRWFVRRDTQDHLRLAHHELNARHVRAVGMLDDEMRVLATDPTNFRKMITEAVKMFSNFKVVATTLRNAKTASVNDWGAIIYADGEFHDATLRLDLEIYDRVGGGDSFASGLIYGLMEGKTAAEAVNYGAAHGALAMTTPGDTTTASLKEVEKCIRGGGARVDR